MNKKEAVSSNKRYRLILSAVHMVYRLVNSTFTVEELTLRLTRLLCQFIHASSASVFILDPLKKKVVLIASFDNQINILRDRPKDVRGVPQDVLEVTRGASIFEAHCIGLPLIADDYLGAIFVRRSHGEEAFNTFDREMLSVFAEQAVTAIKNLQLNLAQEQVMLGSIQSIANLFKDQKRQGLVHATTYTETVKMIAENLKASHETLKQLEYASLLHDIGVIDVPYEILAKQTSLTPEELGVIRTHTAHSVSLIRSVGFLKPVLPIILYHHEKYDGTGYPSGLKKEQIPLGARIIAVVDAFEAMVQGRPYRKALSLEEAIGELKKNSGTQFDPKVVGAFEGLSSQKKFRKILSLFKT
jgi:hypothetical protein